MSTAVHSDFILRMRDQFTGPLRKAQRSTNNFSRSATRGLRGVSDSFRRVQRLAGLALAVVTTGRIARMVTNFAQMGDEVAKTARQLGISAQALQELRHAADLSGISAGDLDTSFRRMNVSVSDFQRRQGALFHQLRATNPALSQQLSTVDNMDDAFTLLMRALEEEENAARRAALAQAAFGRSGQSLIVMAQEGGDAIQRMREEAHTLGMVMDDETMAASENFNDSITRLRGSLRRLQTQAMLPVIELLNPMIDRFTEAAKASGLFERENVEQFLDRVVGAGRRVRDMWQSGLIPAVLAGVVAFKTLTAAATAVQSIMILVAAAKKSAAVAGGVLNAVLLSNPIGLVVVAVSTLIGAIVLLIRRWDDLRDRIMQTRVGRALFTDIGSPEEGRARNAQRYGMQSRAPQAQMFGAPVTQSTITENRSTVEVDFRGMPTGSRVRQRGVAPGVSINTGSRDSNWMMQQQAVLSP